MAPATASPKDLVAMPVLRSYLRLTKPKVSLMIAFTAVVGMLLASPGWMTWSTFVFATSGILLASGAAAAFNHVLDHRIDSKMARTRGRPIPMGQISSARAIEFAVSLTVMSMVILIVKVNALTAVLTFASLIGYAFIYTLWLKRTTPQNIVIGGAAGAAAPILGWCAVAGRVDSPALILFLIVFTWTPPHFWALAIARRDEYARVGIPMLPVTHGVQYTSAMIVRYTLVLLLGSTLPYLTGMSGMVYLSIIVALNFRLFYLVLKLRDGTQGAAAMRTFRFSITYLLSLFAALLLDHYFTFARMPVWMG